MPGDVDRLLTQYEQLVDEALPGRLEGIYLVGSLALGDFRTAQSDVDVVAVMGSPLTPTECRDLTHVHRVLRAGAQPDLDGIYVTWADLERDPAEIENVPFARGGVFHPAGGFNANPAIWLTLREHPVSVRGPAAPAVWHDANVLREWNLANLNSYWRHQVEVRRSAVRRLSSLVSRRFLDETIAWCVPGVARLHYTIVTGNITSKSGACTYALTAFPDRWHAIIQDALALRNGNPLPQRSRRERLDEALRFMDVVIADANRRAHLPQ